MPKWWAALLVFGGIGLNLLIIGPTLRLAWDGAGDFSAFYAGARLVPTGDLYDPAVVYELQKEVVGGLIPAVIPVRLPFYYALLWPIGQPPYVTARVVWVILNLAAILAFTRIQPTPDRTALWLASGFSLPLVSSIVVNQDVAILLLIVAAALWLRNSNRPWIAGLMASLVLMKFHLFLPFPVLLFLRREFRMLKGFITGCVLLIGVSFLVSGPRWLGDYVRLVRDPLVTPEPSVLPNLHVLSSMPYGTVAEIVLSLIVGAAFLFIASRGAFETAWVAALIAGLLVGRHAYMPDCALLIPGALAIALRGPGQVSRGIAFLALTPLPYAPVVFGLGIIPAAMFTALLLALCAETRLAPTASAARP